LRISYKRNTKGERNGKHSETKNSIWGYCGWVIERTLAWIGRYRRMSKDYEYLTSSSEAMVYLTMLRLMLTRLAKQNEKQFVTYKEKQAA
jgi:transposase